MVKVSSNSLAAGLKAMTLPSDRVSRITSALPGSSPSVSSRSSHISGWTEPRIPGEVHEHVNALARAHFDDPVLRNERRGQQTTVRSDHHQRVSLAALGEGRIRAGNGLVGSEFLVGGVVDGEPVDSR